MGRGRKRKVSDDRLLLELLLHDGPAFASDIEPHVDLGQQQIRDRLNELADGELIGKREAAGRNLYELTVAGWDEISSRLRAEIQ